MPEHPRRRRAEPIQQDAEGRVPDDAEAAYPSGQGIRQERPEPSSPKFEGTDFVDDDDVRGGVPLQDGPGPREPGRIERPSPDNRPARLPRPTDEGNTRAFREIEKVVALGRSAKRPRHGKEPADRDPLRPPPLGGRREERGLAGMDGARQHEERNAGGTGRRGRDGAAPNGQGRPT